MIICNNCSVELEPDMAVCPLCEEAVTAGPAAKGLKPDDNNAAQRHRRFDARQMSVPQRKATWELVSIILILLVITTSLINYIINKEISWAEYPVAIYLIIFSYVSSFAFLNSRREIQLLCAFAIASLFIFALDTFTGGHNWALQLGIPLLFFVSIMVIGLLFIIRSAKQKGINLIAYTFMAATLLCIGIEATTDWYAARQIRLVWSLIVSACVFPVAAVLLFMHFRMKKGRDLNRTFHI